MMQAEDIVMMRELSTFKELKEQNRNLKKKNHDKSTNKTDRSRILLIAGKGWDLSQ